MLAGGIPGCLEGGIEVGGVADADEGMDQP